ncbi:MAG: Polysulfide reductase NrfD, partial [Clostridia bacterium 62_21]
GGSYFPSWMEFTVTAGLIAGAVLVYCFVVENFSILPEEHAAKPSVVGKGVAAQA